MSKDPGARPRDIAAALEITPANVQNVLRKAVRDTTVKRESGGYANVAPG